ncbi:MAG: hypothetical protein CSA22_07025 [Deltaproteobacteria bacterium]|nr:MAG: hypothetical protein CSA22_07025 [Deltaproteobacteria bacterium]
MRAYYSDTLYQARFGEYSGFVYFLFEHKSPPEKRIFLQFFTVYQGLWKGVSMMAHPLRIRCFTCLS